MSARNPKQEPAIERARRIWHCATADVYRTANRAGTTSAWLKDAGGRPSRAVKAPDQLARLVREMQAAGYTLDAIDAVLVALVRGITQSVVGIPPAA